MIDIQNRLNQLLEQKKLIEKEISQLQSQLVINQKPEKLSKDEKIELFKILFVGRCDIYAKLWKSKQTLQERFYPAVQTFKKDDYLPLSNQVIEKHLRGEEYIATYPILEQNKCKYLVLKIIKGDKNKLNSVLKKHSIQASFEITSSGDFKVWIFFNYLVEAKKVFLLGKELLIQAQISGEIFPNQEFSNAGNLGKCVELPLYLKHRKEQKTVFTDENSMKIVQDQWSYLKNIKKMDFKDIGCLIKKYEESNTLCVFDDIVYPVNKLKIYINDALYISTKDLSKSLLNLLKSYATFDNPQIKILLSLRRPLYNTPKKIQSYEEQNNFLKLPRGLWQKVKELFENSNVKYELVDKRVYEKREFSKILYTLRQEQIEAINSLKKYDFSICVAPPGFGKTLIGAKMVELRQATTLVIVNKNMLLEQWIDRFCEYFGLAKKDIGYLGKGKNGLNGKLDVATMQSLKNKPELVLNYSFVIVDECHHIPAVTFEQIIKQFKGKYLLGLSATPNRKDALEPILFQQLGNIAYSFKAKKSRTNKVKVIKTQFESTADNYAQLINEICLDSNRNNQILEQIIQNKDRTILVLTDRLEHISELEKLLELHKVTYLSVHGNQNKKEQSKNMLQVSNAKLILATTSFFGEGIDFPHLNTIIFATPISYYGRLVQYLGRVGRDGQDCLAIDFLDSKNAMLNSAYRKRKEGYKQMHYSLLGVFE